MVILVTIKHKHFTAFQDEKKREQEKINTFQHEGDKAVGQTNESIYNMQYRHIAGKQALSQLLN